MTVVQSTIAARMAATRNEQGTSSQTSHMHCRLQHTVEAGDQSYRSTIKQIHRVTLHWYARYKTRSLYKDLIRTYLTSRERPMFKEGMNEGMNGIMNERIDE